MNKKIKYAVIGAGNGGQAVAGYLGYLGYEVRLYDAITETVEKIRERGGIQLEGVISAFGPLSMVTDFIGQAVTGADIVMIVNPSIYHREIAQKCVPYLNENQVIFLHPGATFGAFAFKKALEDFGFSHDIPIAESNTLIYACRAPEPGRVIIAGIKDRLLVATLPAKDNDRIGSMLKEAYPQIEMAHNVLVTSLDNTNPIVHPCPTLLSVSWVESDKDFLYYYEGISDTIGKYIMKMDDERIGIGKVIGLKLGEDLFDINTQYDIEYHVKGDNLSDIVRGVDAYKGIYGPKTLKTRYIYEDIPMGLVPIAEIGKLVNKPVENIELIIELGEKLLNEDFKGNGRNLKNLGLEGMTGQQIVEYAESGEKA